MSEKGRKLQNRYRIERQIGQGGMGSVYIATDERFGSTVAIKETLCMDDNYRKAIEREAKLLNSLKHNALPKVTDHFEEENSQFLVMEYIPGDDLSVALETRTDPFPVKDVLDWADQLLEALDFLHNLENPVIHRDIKPQNLKLSPQGKITLLDFGLAKGNVTGAGTQTNAKSIFGYSRNYASLEQIQGTGTDPRSDLYSLAATLYHLLTLEPPEDALTRAMSVLSQKPDPLVPANQISDKVPAGVAAILHKALDLDAAERPAKAAAMRDMLRHQQDYAELALSTVSVARADKTDIYSRETELMPGVTQRDRGATTELGGARSDENLSQVTAIRPYPIAGIATGANRAMPALTGGGGRGVRKFVFTAGALALALVAAGAAVLYWGYPLSEPDIRSLEVPVVETLPAVSTVEEPAREVGSGTAAAANAQQSDNSGHPSATAKRTTTAPQKEPETTGSGEGDDEAATDDRMNAGKVVINGNDIDVGNIKVRNGMVRLPDGRVYPLDEETKRELRELQNQRRREFDVRNLTPAQRRRLRQLNQRYPQGPPNPPAVSPDSNN